MQDDKIEVSESETFLQEYKILLQKVKQRFKVKDHKYIGISKTKASLVLNNKQFDILTLIEMASFVNYDVQLFFKERKI